MAVRFCPSPMPSRLPISSFSQQSMVSITKLPQFECRTTSMSSSSLVSAFSELGRILQYSPVCMRMRERSPSTISPISLYCLLAVNSGKQCLSCRKLCLSASCWWQALRSWQAFLHMMKRVMAWLAAQCLQMARMEGTMYLKMNMMLLRRFRYCVCHSFTAPYSFVRSSHSSRSLSMLSARYAFSSRIYTYPRTRSSPRPSLSQKPWFSLMRMEEVSPYLICSSSRMRGWLQTSFQLMRFLGSTVRQRSMKSLALSEMFTFSKLGLLFWMLLQISWSVKPLKGQSPQISWQYTMPTDQMSAFRPQDFSWCTSGALVSPVPRMVVVMPSSLTCLAKPRSAILQTFWWRRTLAALKSRCMASISCSPLKPLMICLRKVVASFSVRRPLLSRYSCSSPPSQSSITMTTLFSLMKLSTQRTTFSLRHSLSTRISVFMSSMSLGVRLKSSLGAALAAAELRVFSWKTSQTRPQLPSPMTFRKVQSFILRPNRFSWGILNIILVQDGQGRGRAAGGKWFQVLLIQQFQNILMSFNPQDYVSPFVTLEEVLEIKKAFDLFDRDLGGAIDPKELKVAINSLGIEAKAQAVYQMIAELDSDGSGQIEFPEFFYMMTTRPSDNESRDEVHKVFITFDAQKTGFIALKDLRKVAKDLGELTDDGVLQEMIERADADGDGVVSEEEFYNLITKKAH